MYRSHTFEPILLNYISNTNKKIHFRLNAHASLLGKLRAGITTNSLFINLFIKLRITVSHISMNIA